MGGCKGNKQTEKQTKTPQLHTRRESVPYKNKIQVVTTFPVVPGPGTAWVTQGCWGKLQPGACLSVQIKQWPRLMRKRKKERKPERENKKQKTTSLCRTRTERNGLKHAVKSQAPVGVPAAGTREGGRGGGVSPLRPRGPPASPPPPPSTHTRAHTQRHTHTKQSACPGPHNPPSQCPPHTFWRGWVGAGGTEGREGNPPSPLLV